MKHVRGIAAVLTAFCLLLSSPALVRAENKSSEKYGEAEWEQLREDYLDTETDRLILVKCTGGTRATVEMWEKVSVSGSSFGDGKAASPEQTAVEWNRIVSCNAYTGINGLGKKKEGDRKTPVGIFNITMAFGRKKSPGTAGISYTKLNRYHYWSDERDTYNQFIDVRDLNRSKMSGEHLIRYDPWYNYALALDYNRACKYKKGSAIFLHCVGGGRASTMGCIAVPEKNMKTIVENTTEHTKICIFPSEEETFSKGGN